MSLNKISKFIIIYYFFCNNLIADTRILTNDFDMTISGMVAGDTINVDKDILIEQDPSNSNFKCWIKAGNTNTLLNADNGKAITVSSNTQSFDIQVTFPNNCVNGSNLLNVSGVAPVTVLPDEVYTVLIKPTITYD